MQAKRASITGAKYINGTELAMKLGKNLLRQFGTPFSPDAPLRWDRRFVAQNRTPHQSPATVSRPAAIG